MAFLKTYCRSLSMCNFIPLENLNAEKFGQLICYPKYDFNEFVRRINCMKELGIKSLCFHGGKIIANLPVLGKGCTSIVLLALMKDYSKAALKICRTDSSEERIAHEARMLQIANSVNVGPKLLGYRNGLLLMQYIEGKNFPEWISGLGDDESNVFKLRRVLKDLLEQCWRLDSIGLDHGELSWADKHLIVDFYDGIHIVDFETASNERRTANVTSISQYLFIKGSVAKIIMQRIGCIDRDALISALRRYKRTRLRKDFESIFNVVRL